MYYRFVLHNDASNPKVWTYKIHARLTSGGGSNYVRISDDSDEIKEHMLQYCSEKFGSELDRMNQLEDKIKELREEISQIASEVKSKFAEEITREFPEYFI